MRMANMVADYSYSKREKAELTEDSSFGKFGFLALQS
jgi:hypothetical protein